MLKKLKRAYIEWWGRRLPDCDATTRAISRAMDGSISFRKRILVALHNHICEWCARYKKQLLLLRTTVREQTRRDVEDLPSGGPAMSPEALNRLKRNLSRQ